MHPLSTVLFALGYGLALPIIAKLPALKARGSRLGLVGHQVGMGIAMIAWATRGRTVMVLLHVAWIIGVRIWFTWSSTTND